jgi:hypothetical protein
MMKVIRTQRTSADCGVRAADESTMSCRTSCAYKRYSAECVEQILSSREESSIPAEEATVKPLEALGHGERDLLARMPGLYRRSV